MCEISRNWTYKRKCVHCRSICIGGLLDMQQKCVGVYHEKGFAIVFQSWCVLGVHVMGAKQKQINNFNNGIDWDASRKIVLQYSICINDNSRILSAIVQSGVVKWFFGLSKVIAMPETKSSIFNTRPRHAEWNADGIVKCDRVVGIFLLKSQPYRWPHLKPHSHRIGRYFWANFSVKTWALYIKRICSTYAHICQLM